MSDLELIRLRRRVAELEAALERYGHHLRGCKREDMLPCSCGFVKATQFSGGEKHG